MGIFRLQDVLGIKSLWDGLLLYFILLVTCLEILVVYSLSNILKNSIKIMRTVFASYPCPTHTSGWFWWYWM